MTFSERMRTMDWWFWAVSLALFATGLLGWSSGLLLFVLVSVIHAVVFTISDGLSSVSAQARGLSPIRSGRPGGTDENPPATAARRNVHGRGLRPILHRDHGAEAAAESPRRECDLIVLGILLAPG